ncbi:MAG TPA: GNAT family N-acetyltransferase [Burkholderiales bacterium]|nr:GNAT family N-acetyltransferase [Burkholderiales bacterium]
MARFSIEPVRPEDVGHVMDMIAELAAFERLEHLLECTAAQLSSALFGPDKSIECLLGWSEQDSRRVPVAYAIFFHNFSTFLGRRGLYLEDLYVRPAFRHRGHARAILAHLAALALERDCGRFEWTVLDWNTGAQDVYRSIGAEVLPEWRITRMTGDSIRRLAGK